MVSMIRIMSTAKQWVAVAAAVAAVSYTQVAARSNPVDVRADALSGEVVVSVTGLHLPAHVAYAHHPDEQRVPIEWTYGGWIRGYRIDLLDRDGRVLSRDHFHHAGIANLDRRQLAYPQVERLAAIGRETRPIALPKSMGMPVDAGSRLLLYYAVVNPGDAPLHDVTLRLTLVWTPPDATAPREVYPLFLDANPKAVGGTRAYDLPPGLSAMSAQFTLPVGGHLRALGGHLHDYAVEIRLEDVLTGRTLARLGTKRNRTGQLLSVDTTKFLLKRRGLRLEAGRRYRVVGVYDNPTGTLLPEAAMAFLAGPFTPDDASAWPAVDRNDSTYQLDLAGLMGVATPHADHHRSPGAR